jgi:hypothetical protein
MPMLSHQTFSKVSISYRSSLSMIVAVICELNRSVDPLSGWVSISALGASAAGPSPADAETSDRSSPLFRRPSVNPRAGFGRPAHSQSGDPRTDSGFLEQLSFDALDSRALGLLG